MNPAKIRLWRALNWPNRISLLRLLLTAPFVMLLLNVREWPPARYLAMGLFVLMAVSDLADGVLARRLNARTRLGAILDPLGDKVFVICATVLLSLDATQVGTAIPNYVVVAIVGKDLWVIVGFLVVYLVTGRVRVRPTRAGKACTVGQVVMVGLVLLSPDVERLAAGAGAWIVWIASWAAAGLSVLAAASYTRLGLAFIVREDRPVGENNNGNSPRDRRN